MPKPEAASASFTSRAAVPADRLCLMASFALACLVFGVWTDSVLHRILSLAVAITFGLLIAALLLNGRMRARAESRQYRAMFDLVDLDATPCFVTDNSGEIAYRNGSARTRFGEDDGKSLVAALGEQFASPTAVLFRLKSRALNTGTAREDVVTRRGHLRLSATHMGEQRLLWRLEEFQDRTSAGRGAESLSLPMLVANKQGVILFSNEAMRRLLGQRPKTLDRVFTSITLNSGEEVEVAAATGPVRAILAEVSGAGERREIFLLPIPERSADDTALADFEHVPVALMKFTPEGSLFAANRAAREMISLEPGQGAEIHDLFDGLGRPVADWLADVAHQRLPGSAEVLLYRHAQEETYFQLTLRRIVEFGRVGVLAVLNDATALKTLEAQFAQSQKMQAIGQLAGGIAHDFNNLLTAISGHCDLLLLRHNREDTDYADLVQIHQNANRAAALVGQLLAFSRKQTLKPEPLDLQEVLSDLTHLLNRLVGERVKLRFAHDPLLGPIRADKRKLEQVLMNLVVNARDAMTAGGVIRIETEALHLSQDLHRDGAVVPAGEYSVIKVKDTGCGIPAEQIERIFEPFFTTKRVGEGTGLGLSMAYGIVKQSGGFIFVSSSVGEGTEFQIFFPVNDLPAVEKPVESPKKVVLRAGEGVVLLVEDEAPVRAFASRALRLRGYTVLEADCAEDALKTLEDPALQVDVFVTDVVMPGMDGPSWVRRALQDRPGVKVVFVSGYAEDCLSESQARIPNSVFLPKPFSLTDLTATVQGQMH